MKIQIFIVITLFIGFCFSPIEAFCGEPVPEPALAEDGLGIAIIGDSILFGVGLGEALSDKVPSLAFPALLSDLLELNVEVQGWPGATAERLATFYQKQEEEGQQLNKIPLDLVFINIGANHRHHSTQVYEKRMQFLLDAVRVRNPESKIILLNFFRMRPDRLKSLEKLQIRMMDTNVDVWDVRAAVVGYADAGIHPDSESHVALAKILAERIREEEWGAKKTPNETKEAKNGL